jgi:hypothetical protein
MLTPIDRETERSLVEEIDPTELERHLDAFDGLHRYPGTEDEREASEYVVETLAGYGVDATLHEHEAYVSVPESAALTVTHPTRRGIEEAITVSFGASTPPSGVSAELAPLPDAPTAGGTEGRVLLVDGRPNPVLVRRATRAGAVALVCVSPNEHLYEGIVSPVWGTPSTESAADLPDLPVAEVTRTDGDWLWDRLEGGPVEVTVETSVTTELRTLPCAMGRIEGSGSDRYFVVGNHVDSWYEGITDNATAMAVTLELARIFADREPRRGLVFGFWAGHSTGRYAGSAWYVDEHWLDLRENAVAYLHLDLNGLRGADSLWYQHMAELGDEHLDAMASATSLSIREAEESYLGATGRPARNSDQSFWGVGASSLLSGARLAPGTEEGGPVGGGWWWHTPEDTRDKVDMDVMVEETKLYLTIAARICESPVLPHEFAATAADADAVLGALESAVGEAWAFDAARERLATFTAAAESFDEFVDERGGKDDDLDAAIEDVQVRLGNVLTPALYTSQEATDQESAYPVYDRLPYLRIAASYPDLTGRDRRFAETDLRRGENRLAHELSVATRTVEAFLDEHA